MSIIMDVSPPEDLDIMPGENGGLIIMPGSGADEPIRVNGGPGDDTIIIGSPIAATVFNITANIEVIITEDDDLIGDVVGGAIGGAIGTAIGTAIGGSLGSLIGGRLGIIFGDAIAGAIGGAIGGSFSSTNEVLSSFIASSSLIDENLNIEEILAELDLDAITQNIDVLEVLQTLDIEESLEGITLEELAQQVQETLDNLDTDQLLQDLDIPAIESNIEQLEAAVNAVLEATALVNAITNTPDLEPTDFLVPAREVVNAFDNAIALFQEQGIDSSLLEEQRTLLANAIGGQANGLGGNDTIIGGDGYDLILGGSDNDSLIGGGSDDTMGGGEGNDTIDGEEGNDTIDGEEGNDSIIGGSGTDIIYGGKGDDTISGDSDSIDVEIEIEISGEQKLTASGTLNDFRGLFEDIGDSVSELIDGSQETINDATDEVQEAISNAIDGVQQAINDDEDDLSNTQVINDLSNNIVLSIENLSQILQDNGLNVIDEQLTSSFLETLTSFQADFISGGAGNDLLIGGVGADTFHFEDITPGEIDTITDFTPGVDQVNLTSSDILFEEGGFIYKIETGIVSYDPDGIANNGDELDFLQIDEDLDIDLDDFKLL